MSVSSQYPRTHTLADCSPTTRQILLTDLAFPFEKVSEDSQPYRRRGLLGPAGSLAFGEESEGIVPSQCIRLGAQTNSGSLSCRWLLGHAGHTEAQQQLPARRHRHAEEPAPTGQS